MREFTIVLRVDNEDAEFILEAISDTVEDYLSGLLIDGGGWDELAIEVVSIEETEPVDG